MGGEEEIKPIGKGGVESIRKQLSPLLRTGVKEAEIQLPNGSMLLLNRLVNRDGSLGALVDKYSVLTEVETDYSSVIIGSRVERASINNSYILYSTVGEKDHRFRTSVASSTVYGSTIKPGCNINSSKINGCIISNNSKVIGAVLEHKEVSGEAWSGNSSVWYMARKQKRSFASPKKILT